MSAHRWRLAVLLSLYLLVVTPIATSLQESATVAPVIVQGFLIAAFAFAGWFLVVPLWRKLGSRPVMAVVIWLIPILVMAVIGLIRMNELVAGPIGVYLFAPILRLSKPQGNELLPRVRSEWGWEMLVFGLLAATVVAYYTQVPIHLIQRIIAS